MLSLLVHEPHRRLRQRLHQMPDFGWKHLHLSRATLNQQPIPVDLDR